MIRKKFLVSGVLFLGALGLVGCGEIDNAVEEPQEETDSIDSPTEVEAQYTTSVNQELIDEHDGRHEEIMNDFHTGDYTFEEPLVVLDPYDRAP